MNYKFYLTIKNKCWLIFIPPVILLLLGVSLLLKGYEYPLFKDQKMVKALFESGGPPDCLTEEEREKWQESFAFQLQKYQTPRESLIDPGSGLISLGLSLIVFALIFRVYTIRDLIKLRTPKSWFSLTLLLNVVVIADGVAYIQYVLSKDDGFHYPPWADSLGIPILLTIGGVILKVCVFTILAVLITRFSKFPAMCFFWDAKLSFRNVGTTLIAVFLLLLNLLNMAYCIYCGNFLAVPITVLWSYLLMSLRSGFLQYTKSSQKANGNEILL